MSKTRNRRYEEEFHSNRNKNRTDIKAEYDRIKRLYVSKNFQRALWECNDFILKYPNMEKAKVLKATILRKCGRYEEALLALDSSFLYNDDFAHVEKIRNYMCLGRNEEAYELLLQVNPGRMFSEDKRMQQECMLLDMALLLEVDPELFSKTYTRDNYHNYRMNQFAHYNEEATIRYIRNNNKGSENWKFYDSFDVEENIKKFKDEISIKNPFPDVLYDVYYLSCKNCGEDFGDLCDFVIVYTVKGTNQIIDMRPIPEERIRKEKKQVGYTLEDYKKRDMIKRFQDRYSKKRG